MSLVSNMFILFAAASVCIYYLLPEKYRWCGLLVCSYWYYLASGVQYVFFILFSTIVTYGSALLISRHLTESKRRAKLFLVSGLVLNFGMLGIVKYTNFVLENKNAVFHMDIPGIAFLLPLGISFYTFQSSGYLLDVYWKRTESESNFLKYALFVSFFPQLLQGPIGRHSRLAAELYTGHRFEFSRIQRGIERILWGFFKKMVLADWAAVFVDAIFTRPDLYSGLSVFGVLFYSAQLYADFSGGMDVVAGTASLFGITLDENFKRPFSAVSITDFWHRWHITLGTWMKDYVFYPLSLSKGMNRFGKWGKKVFGKKTGRKLPICLANIVVFFLVGVKYIVYGLYNGLILAFSGLMADRYREWKKALHIQGKEGWYHVFMVLRTFILVNISWYFDCCDTVSQALHMMKLAATRFQLSQLLLIPAGREGAAFTPYVLVILASGCLLVFFLELLEERGMKVRERIAAMPAAVHFGVCLILLLSIGAFGSTAAVRGFIYAQF